MLVMATRRSAEMRRLLLLLLLLPMSSTWGLVGDV